MTDSKPDLVPLILDIGQDNLMVIAVLCNKAGVDIKEVLVKKYSKDMRTLVDLIIKLHGRSIEKTFNEDFTIPRELDEVEWICLFDHYKFMHFDILDKVAAQELLKAEYHPKTRSAFRRMIVVTVWHMLQENVEKYKDGKLLKTIAVELKSTIGLIPFSEYFKSIHLITQDGIDARLEKMREELVKQEWWKNTVV